MNKAHLEELYKKEIQQQLKQELKLENVMDIPKLSKITLNIGVKEAVGDSKAVGLAVAGLEKIAGQKPVKTIAKKSIAGFKLREGMTIGAMVTLRRKKMYDFLAKLINLSLPKVRDFQGVTKKFDGRGNYNLGIKEWIIFPEIHYDVSDKVFGLNITIHTTAKTDEHGFALLKSFGMPFRK